MNIDWSSIRAACVALKNVNEAARRASSHLPPDEQRRFIERVNKRSQRECWRKEWESMSPVVANEQPLSKNVQSGAEIIAARIADDSSATKIAILRATRKGTESIAEKDGDEITELAKPLKELAGAASLAGSWGDKGNDQSGDTLILSIGGNVNLGQQNAGG